MKRKSKAVSMLSVLTLTAGMLAGCSSKASGTENGQVDSQAAEEAFNFESVSDVTFPLKEKLTFTVFVKASSTGGGTYQDNYVTDWIEEQTNIHLEYVYDVDDDEAKTKLNLVMTNPDNLPDLFLATGWSKAELQSYGEQGMIIPIEDMLDDADNWNRLNDVTPGRREDLVMSDGHIYTFGVTASCFHCMYQNRMYIYKPWVEKYCDGKIPTTTDELYDFLTKVKNGDPNGNGIADEIPMTGFIGGWSSDPTVWMINSFTQCNNPLSNTNPTVAGGLVVNDEGKIEYAVMKDEYRDAIRYMHKLYAEGLLDNQTFTQDNTQFSAAMDPTDGNKVAVYANGGVENSEFWEGKDGAWQDWEIFEPVEGPGGVRLAARSIQSHFGSCIGAVSSNCKYPVIAVALYNFLASHEASNVQFYGPQGVGWDWVDEGTSLGGGTATFDHWKIPDDYDWVGNGFARQYPNWTYTSDAIISDRDLETRNGERIEDPSHNGEYFFQSCAERYAQYDPGIDHLVPDLVFEGEDAQTISEGTVTIGGYVNQALVQFITGDLDIEKDWDSYISKLENMGVENYIAIWQRYYDAYVAAGK